jgi:hypothetical protein
MKSRSDLDALVPPLFTQIDEDAERIRRAQNRERIRLGAQGHGYDQAVKRVPPTDDDKPERRLRMVTPRMRAAARFASTLRRNKRFRRLYENTERLYVLLSGRSGEKRSFESWIARQLQLSEYSLSEIAHALWGKDDEYRVENPRVYKQAEDRARQMLRLYHNSTQRRLALIKTPRKPESMNALLVRIALSPAKDLLALRRQLRAKLNLLT